MTFATELRSTTNKALGPLRSTQKSVERAGDQLNKLAEVTELSVNLKSDVAAVRRSAKAVRTALRLIPPIPAGPVGPVITILKKVAGAVATTIEKGLGSVDHSLKTINTSTKGVRVAVDKTRGGLDGVSGPLDPTVETLGGVVTVAGSQADKFNGLFKQQREQVLASALVVVELTGQLKPFNDAVDEAVRTVKPSTDRFKQGMKTLNEYGKPLRELKESVSGLASTLESVGKAIKGILDKLPAWVKDGLEYVQDAIKWVLEKTRIQVLLDAVARQATQTIAALINQATGVAQMAQGLNTVALQLQNATAAATGQLNAVGASVVGESGLGPVVAIVLAGIQKGYFFRADDGYVEGESVGMGLLNPKRALVRHKDTWTHVKEKESGQSSRYTSWSKERKNVLKFSSTNPKSIWKTKRADIAELEMKGSVRVWTDDEVAKKIKAHEKKKVRKKYRGVPQQMRENKEVLIEGEIPGNIIKPAKH